MVALQRLDEARTELIAMVTHELRTPLAVVRAYADLLADDPPLDGRPSRDPVRRALREEWYQGTLSQIDRLDRLVDSILASIRPSTEGPVEVVPIDVGALLEELVVELKPLLRQHRIERHVEVRRHALADPPRLRQIIEHLVENAVKYAPPETTITVDVTLVEGIVRWASATRVRASRPSGASGSSSPTPGAIPTPRAGPESACTPPAGWPKRWAPGYGVSLLRATAPNSSLPCPRPWPSEEAQPVPNVRPLRILVVDDDPAMVGAITALVGQDGHQVITAYDGLTAVRRFREESPDLVLLDLAMPGPDGFSVSGQIRAAGNVPILIVSGESGEGAKVRAGRCPAAPRGSA